MPLALQNYYLLQGGLVGFKRRVSGVCSLLRAYGTPTGSNPLGAMRRQFTLDI